MLKIGDFSRISQVTIKTLRHYDHLGLLKPAHVDPFTDHRFYSLAQMPRLNRILALREMGLSLAQIGQLLDEELSPQAIRGMFRLKQVELEDEVRQAHLRLQRVENRIQLIEQEGDMPDYEVVVKQTHAQQMLSVRQIVPDSADIEALFTEIGEVIKREGIKVSGPWLALYHHEGFRSTDLDMEIGVPVEKPYDAVLLGDGRSLVLRQLAAFDTVATVIENGHNPSWDGSYGQLGQWLEDNNYEIVLPTREVFLTQPADPTGWLIEIQFPVKKKSLEA